MKLLTMIGLGTAAVGGIAAAFGVWLAIQSFLRAQTWKLTTGQVVGATIHSSEDSEAGKSFFAIYTMRYEAAGQWLETSLRLGPYSSSEQEIQSRISRHPPGTRRTLFHNPAKPSHVEAEKGSSLFRAAFGAVSLGLVFLIVGGLMWYGTRQAEW